MLSIIALVSLSQCRKYPRYLGKTVQTCNVVNRSTEFELSKQKIYFQCTFGLQSLPLILCTIKQPFKFLWKLHTDVTTKYLKPNYKSGKVVNTTCKQMYEYIYTYDETFSPKLKSGP